MTFPALLASMDGTIRDTFGETVTYIGGTAGNFQTVEVTAIFDKPAQHKDITEPGIADQGPVIWLVIADLPADPLLDWDALIVVGETTYRIREAMPDGKGSVRILLHENT